MSGAADPFVVRRLDAITEAQIQGLAAVLVDCVDANASVSFMRPLSLDKAAAFWRDVGEAVRRGERMLFVAQDATGIVGTVQLLVDLPENQPHRADVAKMLVHRCARRIGVGQGLMHAAERAARDAGKTLLVLDTASADAERLYERSGWQRCGTIPGFALLPDGTPCATTFFYRTL
ncbi:MAG: GNAT family N-acetyltransferase [Caldimonas sp.]